MQLFLKILFLFVVPSCFIWITPNRSIINLKEKESFDLSWKNYGLFDQKTFYLKDKSGHFLDSLTLYHLSFKIDSLVKTEKNTWHYIYKVRCGVGCYIVKQIFLTTQNRKLEITFAFLNLTSIDYGTWAGPDYEGLSGAQYKIKKSPGSMTLERAEFSGKNPTPSNKRKYKIKYDLKRKAYYTDKVYFNGHYLVAYSPKFENTEMKIQDTCCVIRTMDETVVKLKGHWFRYRDNEHRFLDF